MNKDIIKLIQEKSYLRTKRNSYYSICYLSNSGAQLRNIAREKITEIEKKIEEINKKINEERNKLWKTN